MTPRRNPYGCVFCPTTTSALVRDDEGDVAHALRDTRRATLRTRTPPAHEAIGRLVREHRLHDQVVEVDVGVLLTSVRDRAVEQLRHQRRRRLLGELQHLE